MSNTNHTFIRLLSITAACAGVIAICASDSSPLAADFTADYAVFQTMARGWIDGMLPYRDLFDHKGPVTYLLYMLGFLICPGKTGVYIVEVIFAATTFELLFRCGRALNISNRLNYCALAVGLVLFGCLVTGGATVEEWSLPFQLIPLLYGLKWLLGQHVRIITTAFVSGICFGIVAMIRINDNAIVCGLCIGIMATMILHRQIADCLRCIAAFISGAALAILPFIIYFGVHHSIDDFLYSILTFNLHYRSAWTEPDTLSSLMTKLLKMTPTLVAPVSAYVYDRRHSTAYTITMTVTAMSAVTLFSFLPGAGYLHYFIMAMPLGVMAVQLTTGIGKIAKIVTIMLVCGPVGIYYSDTPVKNYRSFCYTREQIRARGSNHVLTQAIRAIIPEDERASVYVFGGNTSAPSLIESGHLPVGKYFFLQNKLWTIDEHISADIVRNFANTRPKWIVAYLSASHCRPLRPLLNDYEELSADSMKVCLPPSFHIYRRR